MTPALGKGIQALLPGFVTKTMTVKEVAEALGVDDETVRRHVKSVWPNHFQNGVRADLDESMVLVVKQKIERSGRNDLRNVAELGSITTDLEMKQKAAEVMLWLTQQLSQAETQLAIMTPKAEAFDAFHRSDAEMSITDAGKHFGYKQGEVFQALDAGGYLTSKRMPTSKALDDNILTIREVCIGQKKDGTPKYAKQAVVHATQLVSFKTVLDKRIKK